MFPLLVALLAALTNALAATIPFDLSPAGTDRAIGLSGANEVPPNATEATGGELGSGIFYDDGLNQLTLRVGYGDLAGFTDLSSSLSGVHIHTAPVGVPGPVVIDLAPFTIELTPRSGLITGTLNLSDGQEVDLMAGRDYINIHSTLFPDGEIRGQLIPIPEPQHVTMMALLGFLLLAGIQTFRRGL
jgi:hypothetical protein